MNGLRVTFDVQAEQAFRAMVDNDFLVPLASATGPIDPDSPL